MQTNIPLNKRKIEILINILIIRIEFTIFTIHITYCSYMRLQVAKLQLLFSKFQIRYLNLYILYNIL